MASKIKYNEKTPSSFIYELYTLKSTVLNMINDIYPAKAILAILDADLIENNGRVNNIAIHRTKMRINTDECKNILSKRSSYI